MTILERQSVTPQEAAAMLGVTRKHVYEYIREGILTGFDITIKKKGGARSIRIMKESILEFITSRRINPDKYFQ